MSTWQALSSLYVHWTLELAFLSITCAVDTHHRATYAFHVASVLVLQRGLRIIDLLMEIEADPIRSREGLQIQQIAMELDVHRSTAARLIDTLVEAGYAKEVAGSRRRFRIGAALRSQWPLSQQERQFSASAHDVLTALVTATGECAHAAVPSGRSVLVVDDVETDKMLRVVAGKGRRVPLHCTSAGKVLLAWRLSDMPEQMPARTARTITNPNILAAHLEQVVEQGFALDDEENHLGVRCISAPVFSGIGGPAVGCIGIDGPKIRMNDAAIHDLALSVIDAANRLTESLSEAVEFSDRNAI